MSAQKRGGPPVIGARARSAVAAPGTSQKNVVWNGAIINPSADDAQAAEIAAARVLVRRHLIGFSTARVIAGEMGLSLAGAD
jgi:hypothetical protein